MADAAYDYIVVGAGPAGCATAARLAEARPDLTVALLESGPAQPGMMSNVPLGIAVNVPLKSARNYAYETAPQAGLDGRRGFAPRGRGLGGSTLINAMIYIRGQHEDYDGWAEAGCDGWSWRDVLPYFKRGETNARGADEWHGGDGPLHIDDIRSPNPIAQAFVEAGLEAGYPRNDDFNGARQEGVGFYQVSQKTGRRWNAARAYLGETPRTNLHVLAETQVERILFDGVRASGVRFTRDGTQQTLTARREIVVSCGAYGSPQLLMCSGVGPAAHLREMGVEVVADRAEVGGNLQDHIDFVLNEIIKHPLLLSSGPSMLARVGRAIRPYRREGRGMLTSNAAESGAFLRTDERLDRPDVQLHFVIGLVDDHGRKRNMASGWSVHTCVLRPKSRGTVRLASPDMRDAPVIDPAFFSDEEDMVTMERGVALAQRILDQPAMRPYRGKPVYGTGRESGEELRRHIRARADTIYHPVGTCRMGADAESVLDPLLRVRGVERLRVADASIMPTLISGNTQAPSAMIGERAADFLRQANA